MLVEVCTALHMVLANTFLDRPDVQKMTYYDLWATPVSELTPQNFAEIDHLMVERKWQDTVRE
eukprot:2951724-Pyramimonas_sp.AAC.1